MDERLERLVSSLLYEGYALYPYTPAATKNATPTPFGIVYPPAYAAECAGAHDRARIECVALPAAGATLTATLRWLAPDGRGHQAQERRATLGPVAIGERLTEHGDGWRFTLRSDPDDAGVLVRACVHNVRDVPHGLSRASALAQSLLSVHLLVELSDGRFLSPLDARRSSVNTFPVLATPDDRAVLGAGIVLPDHPRISDGSHGNLFDNTEIEEALVLHVHALSDDERAAAAAQDRVVGDMLERALTLGPEEIIALHSGLTDAEVDPDALRTRGASEVRGEQQAVIDGVHYRRGDTIVLRPGGDRDPFDRMLDGRAATIERIYVDVDDRVHIGVTVDDDPGQQLMRETGRYLFFFAGEVEPYDR
jgi:hypothetical protein